MILEKMLAAVLHDFDDLRLEEVPRPVVRDFGDVVVKINSCGFCATDYKAIKGIRRNVNFPFIPGHEPSGVVTEVGPGVTEFKEGDAVIVQPSGFCGRCEYCRTGRHQYCEHAFTTGGDGPVDVRPGAFAEYMLTVDSSLFHKPADLSFNAACLTEPLSGAWKGVVQYSEITVGDDVVVIGVGSIGLLCMMVAKAAGAGRLIAIDASDYACKQALALGATHAINPRNEDAVKRVHDRKLSKQEGLKQSMQGLMLSARRQLPGLPANEKVVMEALLFNYRWENNRGLAKRIVLTGEKQKLLEAAAHNATPAQIAALIQD
ncbi:MAG: alcohol dehydrogenase catalytic domain-containing protein, partial [Chloroflexota bacterium]